MIFNKFAYLMQNRQIFYFRKCVYDHKTHVIKQVQKTFNILCGIKTVSLSSDKIFTQF